MDDEVGKFLPRFPYERITVRHLLQHSSGIPDYIFGVEGCGPDGKGPKSNLGALEWLAQKKPELAFDPGQEWEYRNTGYALIPLIIGKVSGLEYPEHVRRSVLDKAGMRDNYHISELGEAEFKADGIFGAGDIYSTTRDLLRFHQALSAGEIISPSLQEEAYTSMVLPEGFPAGHGLGWQVADSDFTGRIIHHHGQGDGYRTRFYRFLDKGVVIITLQNAREQYADDAVRVAQQLVFKDTYSLPPLSLAESLSRSMSKHGVDATVALVEAAAKAPDQWGLNIRDLNNLALTFWFQGKRETAIRLFTSYVGLMPKDPAVYMSLGEALNEEQRSAESLAQYRKALGIASADPEKYAEEIKQIKEAISTKD